MLLPNEGNLLRILVGEANKHEGIPTFEWIVQKAKSEGLAGATVLRGIQGFGGNSRMKTSKILRLSNEFPVVIEIVDIPEKIEKFLPIIDNVIEDGLVTLEKVQIKLYRSGK